MKTMSGRGLIYHVSMALVFLCFSRLLLVAQPADGFFDRTAFPWSPERLSLEGTWRLPAREHPLVTVFPKLYSGRGQYPSDALKNTGMDGFDYLKLDETGSRVSKEFSGSGSLLFEHHVREYTGVYVHRHTHYGIVTTPPGIDAGFLAKSLDR